MTQEVSDAEKDKKFQTHVQRFIDEAVGENLDVEILFEHPLHRSSNKHTNSHNHHINRTSNKLRNENKTLDIQHIRSLIEPCKKGVEAVTHARTVKNVNNITNPKKKNEE